MEATAKRRAKWRASYSDLAEVLYVIRVLRNQLGRDRPLVTRVEGVRP